MLAISHFVAVTCAHTLLSAYAYAQECTNCTCGIFLCVISLCCVGDCHFTVPRGSFVRVRYSGPTGAMAVCGHVLLLFLLAH